MNKRKSVLVTSGSKRLGKHISKFFVMNDWDLILHYNNSKVEAEETANELSRYSKNIKLYQADFTKYNDVENLVEKLLFKEKEWIGLVNNAGLFEYDTGIDFTIEKLNQHMSINFSTPALLIQALFKNITKKYIEKSENNMVINIIDAKIEGLNPDYYSYTLSKLAMSGLTKMSALSYAPDLRVNAIAPGIILPAENQNDAEFKNSHKKNILNSSATIDDLYLALDFLTNSNSVTGHISLLDGGAHLAPPQRDVAFK